jgi:hypothetical protein
MKKYREQRQGENSMISALIQPILLLSCAENQFEEKENLGILVSELHTSGSSGLSRSWKRSAKIYQISLVCKICMQVSCYITTCWSKWVGLVLCKGCPFMDKLEKWCLACTDWTALENRLPNNKYSKALTHCAGFGLNLLAIHWWTSETIVAWNPDSRWIGYSKMSLCDAFCMTTINFVNVLSPGLVCEWSFQSWQRLKQSSFKISATTCKPQNNPVCTDSQRRNHPINETETPEVIVLAF